MFSRIDRTHPNVNNANYVVKYDTKHNVINYFEIFKTVIYSFIHFNTLGLPNSTNVWLPTITLVKFYSGHVIILVLVPWHCNWSVSIHISTNNYELHIKICKTVLDINKITKSIKQAFKCSPLNCFAIRKVPRCLDQTNNDPFNSTNQLQKEF